MFFMFILKIFITAIQLDDCEQQFPLIKALRKLQIYSTTVSDQGSTKNKLSDFKVKPHFKDFGFT